MNINLLFENFDSLLDTSEKTKQLNQSILQLAVQGKLVPQDPSDEPAIDLLKRIEIERVKLINEGKIKKGKPLPSITERDIPYKLPKGWKWVRLGEVGPIIGGGTPDTKVREFWCENGVPWLTPADLYGKIPKYISKGKRDISKVGLEKSSAQLLPKGSVLFSSRAPIGYVAIAKNSISTNQGFKSCVPIITEMNEYIYYFLKSSAKFIDSNASGTTFKEISGSKMSIITFPLPPLREQKRIVEKVEKLLNHTEEIEAKLKEKERTIVSLNSSTLHHLLNSNDNEEFLERFQFIIDNFNLLYSDERNVKELKQAILQLAVQGKLVPPDSSDEPVTVLLERIKKEKAKLIKDGEIKKQKPLPPIKEDEIQYELPEGWAWVRLGEVCLKITDGSHNPPNRVEVGIPLLSAQNIQDGYISFEKITHITEKDYAKERLRNDLECGDVLLTIVGTIGRSTVLENKTLNFAIQRSVAQIRTQNNSYYLSILLRSKTMFNYYSKNSSGTAQQGIYLGKMSNAPIPLPPLNEQKRIAKKVDELMKLCNELEAKIIESNDVGDKLFNAILNSN